MLSFTRLTWKDNDTCTRLLFFTMNKFLGESLLFSTPQIKLKTKNCERTMPFTRKKKLLFLVDFEIYFKENIKIFFNYWLRVNFIFFKPIIKKHFCIVESQWKPKFQVATSVLTLRWNNGKGTPFFCLL